MPRLNIERQKKLEPKRMAYAKEQIENKGYKVNKVSETQLQFEHQGKTINFWPYSGWATGSSIKDGRGLNKLLKQLNN